MNALDIAFITGFEKRAAELGSQPNFRTFLQAARGYVQGPKAIGDLANPQADWMQRRMQTLIQYGKRSPIPRGHILEPNPIGLALQPLETVSKLPAGTAGQYLPDLHARVLRGPGLLQYLSSSATPQAQAARSLTGRHELMHALMSGANGDLHSTNPIANWLSHNSASLSDGLHDARDLKPNVVRIGHELVAHAAGAKTWSGKAQEVASYGKALLHGYPGYTAPFMRMASSPVAKGLTGAGIVGTGAGLASELGPMLTGGDEGMRTAMDAQRVYTNKVGPGMARVWNRLSNPITTLLNTARGLGADPNNLPKMTQPNLGLNRLSSGLLH